MKNFLLFISFLFIGACSLGSYKVNNIEQDKLATGLKVKKYGNLYLSGQPKTVDFIKLRQEGFVAVVNLRNHEEVKGYNEKLERNNSLLSGMSYYHAGFNPKEDSLTEDYVDKIASVIKSEQEKGKVLIHCKSSQRASMWVIADAIYNKNATKEQALKMMDQFDLNETLRKKLKPILP